MILGIRICERGSTCNEAEKEGKSSGRVFREGEDRDTLNHLLIISWPFFDVSYKQFISVSIPLYYNGESNESLRIVPNQHCDSGHQIGFLSFHHTKCFYNDPLTISTEMGFIATNNQMTSWTCNESNVKQIIIVRVGHSHHYNSEEASLQHQLRRK